MPLRFANRRKRREYWLLLTALVAGFLFGEIGFGQPKSQGTAKSTDSKSGEGKSSTSKSKRSRPAAATTGVAEYRSKNFAVMTDLSPEDAKDLLKRLETMLVLVEKYYEKRLRSPIGMYVFQDMKVWPAVLLSQLERDGLRAVQDGGGLTLGKSSISLSTGQVVDSAATVYAIADRGTPQHEAVHAYCQLTFGRCGPVWYAEGMAEIGQYWTDKGLGVHCHEGVLDYLQNSEPKELVEIVDTSERTGDSWENYAWRWVLCHMLANNPNYAPRFKPLGLGMLAGQNVNFESVYGPMAKEIQFEYTFFLKHIDQGYRADLCAWDWKSKFSALKGAQPITTKIDAMRGWQASRITVTADEEYEYSVSGTWKTSTDNDACDANGAEGSGKLVGIIFDDYKLSEPFELGTYGTFTPPFNGNLMLRCEDKWNELADNSGKMQVKLKLAGKGNRLPIPEMKPEPAKTTKSTKPQSTSSQPTSGKSKGD